MLSLLWIGDHHNKSIYCGREPSGAAKAFEHNAEAVLVPVERFTDDLFNLRTRLAGEIVQKFVNYRLRLVVVGDVTQHLAKSSALRDFVAEANRGNQLWFVPTPQELDQRLAAASG